MTQRNGNSLLTKQITILLITESPPLKEALRNIVNKTNALKITGETPNCLQALDILLQINPDVVLLDPGIPSTVNSVLLQHIMKQQATPIILLPNQSAMGLKQSFAALGNGAVDCIYKESLYANHGIRDFQKSVQEKITCAAKMDVTSFALSQNTPTNTPAANEQKQTEFLFCEECGARNIIERSQETENSTHCCSECGDPLEVHQITQHKRTHYVTVIAAGSGSYTNLLKIIPQVPAGLSGAIIIVIYDEYNTIDTFSEYIEAISSTKVLRLKDGMSIEGGNCYIGAASENFRMKSHSTRNLMTRTQELRENQPIDFLMQSVSEVFKKNSAGLILSGTERDAEKGVNAIKGNNGISAVLFAPNCLNRQMGENVLRHCRVDKIVDEHSATKFISELHNSARDAVSTA